MAVSKFQVGKVYTTGAGCKMHILANNLREPYPIVGVDVYENGMLGGSISRYTSEGYAFVSVEKHPLNLQVPMEKFSLVRYVHLYRNKNTGELYTGITLDEVNRSGLMAGNYIKTIEICIEGEVEAEG